MKTKNIILAALPMVLLATSCEQDIYQEIDFSVSLSEGNTYAVGDEVKFDFDGNANYILMYTGQLGSEYQYRERTEVAMEDLETCVLKMDVQARYGLADVLDFYVAPTFEGLSGLDADADYEKMLAVEASEYEGWDQLDFTDGASTYWASYEYDITEYADGFTLAMHWNPYDYTSNTQRTYWINASLEVQFAGYDPVTVSVSDMNFTALSMSDAHADNRYHINSGNGSVIFTSTTTADIIMQGVGANNLDYCLDYYVVSEPRKLNSISPDAPLDIKTLTDDVTSYSLVYDEPGEYTATFVATSANVYGSSQEIKSVTFTIVE